MNCRRFWPAEFIESSFTKVFRDGELRKHRENVLMDLEKAMLPASQSHVVAKKLELELREHLKAYSERQKELHQLLRNGRKVIEDLRIQINNVSKTGVNEVKKFVRKCPVIDCRGFLNTNWHCELCTSNICKDCNEVKLTDHVCDEDAKKTMELINKDCKPCPSCGTLIHKLVGCDQMFCVDCKTAFSWKKGTIETGVVHNPHYYQWVRNNNNGVIARNPLDIPCGGLPDYGTVCAFIRKRYRILNVPRTEGYVLSDIHILASHMLNYEMPRFRTEPVNNIDLRVKYLMDDIDETDMKRQLNAREKLLHKQREFINVYRMFVDIASDNFRQYLETSFDDQQFLGYTRRLINEFHSLIRYFNESVTVIGKRYNCVYPGITYEYKLANNYGAYKLSYEQQENQVGFQLF